jgi:hypothetical protein
MIVVSTIISQAPQVDGRIDVTEQHTHTDNTIQYFNYLADSALNLQYVADLRAANINAELSRRSNEVAAATNYEIPLTTVEIMRRITPAEWAAFQSSADTNVMYFRAVFDKTKDIHRNDPLTVMGFNMLVSAGILTQARVAEVLA